MHALREFREALGETGDLQSSGEGVEGLEDGDVKLRGRTLAANVLWLDANPDAKQELAQASPGAVSPNPEQAISSGKVGEHVWSCIASHRGGVVWISCHEHKWLL